jgi:hypothetical protein
VVKRLGNHVEVSVERSELESNRMEHWVRDHVVGRIPGAQHEAE